MCCKTVSDYSLPSNAMILSSQVLLPHRIITSVPLSGFLPHKASPVSLFFNFFASTIEVVLTDLKQTKHNLGRVQVVLIVSCKDMFTIAMSVESDVKNFPLTVI